MQDKDQFFEKLYLKNHERIFNFSYKLVGNEDIAMEITQDCFIRYYKNYGSTEMSESEIVTTLFTIAKNLAGNYVKKLSTKLEFSHDNMDILMSESISFEKRLEFNEIENSLYECLGKLSHDLRTVFLLRVVEELSLQEISKVMNISLSKVYRLLVKATKRLIWEAKQKGIKI